MSYDKFKANVMAAKLQEERERASAFVRHTNREYEGQIKNVGDSVTIKGAGQVTVGETTDGKPVQLSDPETIEGTNAIMTIKHQAYFNFMVPDIDAAQGAGGALSMYRKQAAYKIAQKHDTLIASMAVDPLAKQHAASATTATNQNILSLFDDAVQWLQEKDVPTTERLTAFVTPAAYKLIRQNMDAIDTDNSEMLKRGAVAMYNGMDVVLSNNVHSASNVDYCMVMTDKAVAFVDQITKIEGKRANNYMADEVRGLSLYEAKLIRPKELYVLNIKYS